MLQKELGSPLTPKDLAQMLGVSVQTVRRYYIRWGGIEVAPGTVRFFEHIVKERIDADLDKTRQGTPMAGSGYSAGCQKGKDVSRRQRKESPRSSQVGRSDAADIAGGKAADRHGLADLDVI